MAGPGDPKGLGVDGAKHLEVDKTVIERGDQGVGQRMRQPHQISVMAGGIDDDQAVGTSQRIDRVGQGLASGGLILDADIIGPAEAEMIGNIEVAGDMLGPGAPVFDIMRETSCLVSRSIVATRWPDFISAIAICMATVDLPDPPFSLATTMTRVADMRASMDRC